MSRYDGSARSNCCCPESRYWSSAANNPARHVTAGSSLPPHPSFQSSCCDREPIGAQRRIVDGIRHVDAAIDRNAVEIPALRRQQRRHTGIRIGFVPDGAGKYRGGILVAGDAQRPVGVHHPGSAARTIVADHLKLEAARVLVVADDFEQVRLFLIAEIEPVLEVQIAGTGRLRVDSDHGARIGEKIGRSGIALQRAAKRNEHCLRRRGARIAPHPRFHPLQQRGKGKRDDLHPFAASLLRHEEVEQRAPTRWQVIARDGRVDHPVLSHGAIDARCDGWNDGR